MTRRRPVALSLIASSLLVIFGVALAAQEQWFGNRGRREPTAVAGNSPYDGRFVFVRLRYGSSDAGSSFGRGRSAAWSHDYPRADTHLLRILAEITMVAPRMDGSNILSLDDPALFDFPVAYMAEPGAWQPTDTELGGLRAYLGKGGFVIFDDFRGSDWDNLEEQMRRVLPSGRFVEIGGSHPIFHAFFEIDDPLTLAPPYGGLPPAYYGIFEDNDPRKRLMVIANVNNDIGEYWEFSDTGYAPVDVSNEAYKFGVNYLVYAMTH